MFFTSSGEGSGATAKGPLLGKHTWFSLILSLKGALLSPLVTQDSTPKESVKKKKGFFERLSRLVVKNPKGDRSTIHKSYHSSSVVPGSPLRAPTVTPPVVLTTLPTTPSPVKAPPVIAVMAAEEVMVAGTLH